MSPSDAELEWAANAGLLVDSNLLVPYIVGSVNRKRVPLFKRTRKYREEDYDLLLRVIDCYEPLYTVAHVMAEVSNLTDLEGRERLLARRFLKETIAVLEEPEMPSVRAVQNPYYEYLGLVDAAIAASAAERRCAVLTDDLDLYVTLSRASMPILNFTHLRARAW